jgi:hypothetical protein
VKDFSETDNFIVGSITIKKSQFGNYNIFNKIIKEDESI